MDQTQVGLNAVPLLTAQLNGIATPLMTSNAALSDPASVAVGSPPSSDGAGYVIDTPAGNFTVMELFGAGADNGTFDYQVWGWRQVEIPGAAGVWVPVLLLSRTGAVVGTTTFDFNGTTVRRADDIAPGAAGDYTLNSAKPLPSTAVNNVPQQIVFDTLGCQKLELMIKRDAMTSVGGFFFGI